MVACQPDAEGIKEISIQQTLFGDTPILSQAERAEQGIDRTPEEKQAMRYARAAGIRWAVLTNFERLILFDADEERVVLAFDMPEEYLDRLEDLALWAPADTPKQFDSRMQWYASVQKKPEIGDDFYRFLSDWRLRLAQTIYDHNWKGETLPEAGERSYAHLPEPPLTAVPGKGAPPRHLLRAPDGSLDVDRLRQAVQRTLDRLIILRYADDVGFLDQHDLLEGQLVAMSEELDLTALKSYLEGRDEIVAAYLFGSHARGEAGARSDVDVALLLRPGLPDVAHLTLTFDREVCDVLDTGKADVITLNTAPLEARTVPGVCLGCTGRSRTTQ